MRPTESSRDGSNSLFFYFKIKEGKNTVRRKIVEGRAIRSVVCSVDGEVSFLSTFLTTVSLDPA